MAPELMHHMRLDWWHHKTKFSSFKGLFIVERFGIDQNLGFGMNIFFFLKRTRHAFKPIYLLEANKVIWKVMVLEKVKYACSWP